MTAVAQAPRASPAACGGEEQPPERLVQRLRRNNTTIKAHSSEGALLAESLNLKKEDIGGEGVLIVHAAKQTTLDSGYWFVTLFAIRGRAFQPWPTVIYTVYVVIIVASVQLSPSLSSFKVNNQLVFQGLQVSVSLVGVALFFLQTFRTNSAYNRWWEGRIVWGAMSHYLVGIATTIAAGNVQSRKLARRMLRWSIAFLMTLKAGLRGDSSLAEIKEIMSPDELAQLQALPLNLRSIHCITQLKAAWGAAERADLITSCAAKELEKALPEITIAMGAVRRIMGTPMPFAYLSHLRTFLLIWIAVLPFVFLYYMEWLAIAVCIVIAYSLLGMEAISLEIEAPFGRDFNDLPLDNLTDDTGLVILNAYEETRKLPMPDGTDGDGDWGLDWNHTHSAAPSAGPSRMQSEANFGFMGAGGGLASGPSASAKSVGPIATPQPPSGLTAAAAASGSAQAPDPRTPDMVSGPARSPASAMWAPSASVGSAGGTPLKPGMAGNGSSKSLSSPSFGRTKVAPTLDG